MELETLSKKLKTLTQKPICKVCFKDISRNSLLSFFFKEPSICPTCLKKMNYSFQRGKIDGVDIFSLGEYAPPLSDLLIRYKETLDYELYPVFLSYYAPLIRLVFHDYYLVEVPSSKAKMDKRGFDHLHEMFKTTGLPFIDALIKDDGKEQKKRNALERRDSSKLFHLKGEVDVSSKNILLIDDVITTGTSIKTCLSLLMEKRPNKLKVLVLLRDNDLSIYS